MKIELDLDFGREPKEGDAIVFHNGKLCYVPKSAYLSQMNHRVAELEGEMHMKDAKAFDEIAKLKEEVESLKSFLNENLSKIYKGLNAAMEE